MDILLKQETDSDVEIIESEVLQDQYRAQKLRLITALSDCRCQIPRKWEDFQMFINNVLKFQLNVDLIRSVWVELCAAESLTNTISPIDISSDGENETEAQTVDGLKETIHKIYSEQFSCKSEVVIGDADPGGSELGAQQTGDTIVISDDEEDCKPLSSQHVDRLLVETGSFFKGSGREDGLNQLHEHNISLPVKRKQTRNKIRRSLPASLEEHEAETLREQLLLDKIIELELPQVIKGFIENNNLNNGIKRRKKNCPGKKIVNEILSDHSGSTAISQ